MHAFDGGPLYLIKTNHRILGKSLKGNPTNDVNGLTSWSSFIKKYFIITIGQIFFANSIFNLWTNTHNSPIIHDATDLLLFN